MDSGVNGNLGQYAQELAAEEFRRVPARALNPAPPMGEKIAKVVETRLDLVALTHVQVNWCEKKAWHEIIDIWYESLFAICTREYSKKYLRVVYLEGLPYIFLRNDILRCQVVFEKASSHRNYNSDVIRSWNKCGTNKLKIMYPWRFLKKYLQKCEKFEP